MSSDYYIAVLLLAFLCKKLFSHLFFVCLSKQHVNCTPKNCLLAKLERYVKEMMLLLRMKIFVAICYIQPLMFFWMDSNFCGNAKFKSRFASKITINKDKN